MPSFCVALLLVSGRPRARGEREQGPTHRNW